MSNNVRMPRTTEAAVNRLTALGGVINASGWERAGIIAGLVGPAPGSGGQNSAERSGNPQFALTVKALTELRIVGLKDVHTVMRYRDAWCDDAGLEPPTLGHTFTLPDLDWPPNLTVGERAPGMTPERRNRLMEAGREAGMPTGSKVVDIAANPKALATAIEADEETAKAASEALMNRTLGGTGVRVGGHRDVPDPLPAWRRYTTRITADIRACLMEINQLRGAGYTEEADRALADLREALADGVARTEVIPDSLEGLER
jgi:hypothetical protein